MGYEKLTFSEFLELYKNLTTDSHGRQDVTKFSVTFVTYGDSYVAEVWPTKRGVIIPPAAYIFCIASEKEQS